MKGGIVTTSMATRTELEAIAKRVNYPLPHDALSLRSKTLIFELADGSEYRMRAGDVNPDHLTFLYLVARGESTVSVQEGSEFERLAHEFFESAWSSSFFFTKVTMSRRIRW